MRVDTHRVGCGDLAVRADDVSAFQFVLRECDRALDVGVDLHVVQRGHLAVAVDVADDVNLHVLRDRGGANGDRFRTDNVVLLGNRHDIGSLCHAVKRIGCAVAVDHLGVGRLAVALAGERHGHAVGVVQEGRDSARYAPAGSRGPARDAYLEAGIVDLIADCLGRQLPRVRAQLYAVYHHAGVLREVGVE